MELTLTSKAATVAEHPVKILLIDLENYPRQINELPSILTEYHQVVICYALSNARIPIDWLMPLNDTINKAQLKIFRMTSNGKNAADFGISFYAGMLMSEQPANAHFVIMSDDQDLDHVVNLLKSQHRSAERLGMRCEQKAVSLQSTQVAVSIPVKDAIMPLVKLYCAHLITYKNNRPTKQTSLINSIKSKLGEHKGEADAVFQVLVKLKALQIEDTKAKYFDKKIVELAG